MKNRKAFINCLLEQLQTYEKHIWSKQPSLGQKKNIKCSADCIHVQNGQGMKSEQMWPLLPFEVDIGKQSVFAHDWLCRKKSKRKNLKTA